MTELCTFSWWWLVPMAFMVLCAAGFVFMMFHACRATHGSH